MAHPFIQTFTGCITCTINANPSYEGVGRGGCRRAQSPPHILRHGGMQVCHEVALLICQSAQLEARARHRVCDTTRVGGIPGIPSASFEVSQASNLSLSKRSKPTTAPKICPSGGPRAAIVARFSMICPSGEELKVCNPPLQGRRPRCITKAGQGNSSRFEVVLQHPTSDLRFNCPNQNFCLTPE